MNVEVWFRLGFGLGLARVQVIPFVPMIDWQSVLKGNLSSEVDCELRWTALRLVMN